MHVATDSCCTHPVLVQHLTTASTRTAAMASPHSDSDDDAILTSEQPESVSSQLARAFDIAQRVAGTVHSNFACSGVAALPHPGLVVSDTMADKWQSGANDVTLLFPMRAPDSTEQVTRLKALSSCEPAPVGCGNTTPGDTAVHACLQFSPSHFAVRNSAFDDAVHALVSTADGPVRVGLGIPSHCRQRMEARPYKLLLYESGGHFRPHRDTEKERGMFATLIVQLPCAYEGGALVLRHHQHTAELDLSHAHTHNSEWACHFAAFYCDVTHELQPVTSGYRMCLVYNLVLTGTEASPPPSPTTATADAARRLVARANAIAADSAFGAMDTALQQWVRHATDEPAYMLMPLQHCYTPENFSYDRLVLRDRVVADAVRTFNSRRAMLLAQVHALLTASGGGLTPELFEVVAWYWSPIVDGFEACLVLLVREESGPLGASDDDDAEGEPNHEEESLTCLVPLTGDPIDANATTPPTRVRSLPALLSARDASPWHQNARHDFTLPTESVLIRDDDDPNSDIDWGDADVCRLEDTGTFERTYRRACVLLWPAATATRPTPLLWIASYDDDPDGPRCAILKRAIDTVLLPPPPATARAHRGGVPARPPWQHQLQLYAVADCFAGQLERMKMSAFGAVGAVASALQSLARVVARRVLPPAQGAALLERLMAGAVRKCLKDAPEEDLADVGHAVRVVLSTPHYLLSPGALQRFAQIAVTPFASAARANTTEAHSQCVDYALALSVDEPSEAAAGVLPPGLRAHVSASLSAWVLSNIERGVATGALPLGMAGTIRCRWHVLTPSDAARVFDSLVTPLRARDTTAQNTLQFARAVAAQVLPRLRALPVYAELLQTYEVFFAARIPPGPVPALDWTLAPAPVCGPRKCKQCCEVNAFLCDSATRKHVGSWTASTAAHIRERLALLPAGVCAYNKPRADGRNAGVPVDLDVLIALRALLHDALPATPNVAATAAAAVVPTDASGGARVDARAGAKRKAPADAANDARVAADARDTPAPAGTTSAPAPKRAKLHATASDADR